MTQSRGGCRVWLVLMSVLASGACANSFHDGTPTGPGSDASAEGGSALGKDAAYGNANGAVNNTSWNYQDATVTVDAFFFKDPAPLSCAKDGTMAPSVTVSGTLDCPGDKNREGCPCPSAGTKAACWPGQRVNRNHGICTDGTTTCTASTEFGLRWGACNGYVLPTPGAVDGPSACGCFSSGKWQLTDLAPCIYGTGASTYLYSSHLDAAGTIACNTVVSTPPATPPEAWNSSTLNIDCAGQFKLCYTIKAGDVKNPQAGDCTIVQLCVDTWYDKVGTAQPLPNLPGWSSPDSSCAQKFVSVGGYGEMSVVGKSVECEKVDDGKGNPLVFRRTSYCPPSCLDTPNTPACQACATGGSGSF